MDKTWILLADEGRARILEMPERGGELAEVEEITDAAAHADNADFRRDAYGRRGGGHLADKGGRQMGGNQTESAGEEKLDHEAELFARRVANLLQEAHQRGRFEHLRIAAAPRFLGRLRKQLDPQVARTVDEELDKDLLQLSAREVTGRFFPRQPGA
jgi:protein required for attachment to host cells